MREEERDHAREEIQHVQPDGVHRANHGRRSWIRKLLLILGFETSKSVAGRVAKVLMPDRAAPPAMITAPGPAFFGLPETRRSGDRNMVPERQKPSHQRWGMLLVLVFFIAGICAAVGFLFIYWTNGTTLYLGGTLALCFGGIGSSLVVYARWLMLHKQAVEPREELPSSPTEREAALETFYAGESDIHRRGLLRWIAIATIGVFAAMFISLLRSLARSIPGDVLFDTVWKRGQRLVTEDGKAVSIDTLQPGSFVLVFPEESLGDDQEIERTQTVLIRVEERFLELPRERQDWAPHGYVAYSRVCTHAGCPVGLFETTTNLLLCPCHQSTFDVLRAARPTSGPAARPLPQLPLYADADGTLRAAGGFSAPPGPGFWRTP